MAPLKNRSVVNSSEKWEWAAHGHPTRRIEASTGFVLDDGKQGGADLFGRYHLESKPCVERHVPRYIPEGRKRDRSVSSGRGPHADEQDESRPEAAAPVFGMNIDLLEVGDSRLEHLDVRKPHGNIIRESDPEMAVTVGGFQDFVTGSLGENGLRRLAL